ncbi:MAG: DUF2157 domain-containing protein [Chitinophagaceae bacterium]
MDSRIFEKLHREGLVSEGSMQKIKTAESNKLFSLHGELRTILYLGVLLLSGGLGIIVYKNIDTIGHQVILLVIASICIGCFYYCFRKKLPFSWQQVAAPNAFFDYILLLGCLTLITFITYLQAQYNVFGTRYGLATFIPLVVLFFSAYYFDHTGILCMAIVNLAAWLGIVTTPLNILSQNDFSDPRLIFTGLVLGTFLIAVGFLSRKKDLKQHFTLTYNNFGVHLLMIAGLAALFTFDSIYLLCFLAFIAVAALLFMQAKQQRSFYFVVVITLYTYIAVSYVIMKLLFSGHDTLGSIYVALLYFIASGIGLVLLLIRLNKSLKQS